MIDALGEGSGEEVLLVHVDTNNKPFCCCCSQSCLGRQRQQREMKTLGLVKEFIGETVWEHITWKGAPSKAVVLSSTFILEGQLE